MRTIQNSFQATCGDGLIEWPQLHLQGFDGWTSFPCNHFHHLKVISIKLRVGGTLILSIDLIGTKRTTVFSLENENKPTFNGEHTHMAFCLRINTWCACRLFKIVLQTYLSQTGFCLESLITYCYTKLYGKYVKKEQNKEQFSRSHWHRHLGDIQNGKL